MKNKLLLLVIFILLIVIILVSNTRYPYKENELYNQNDISGYTEEKDESSNLINRNEAVKIATYILKNVLNINLDSKNSQIYINLYRIGFNNNDYNWNISWTKNDMSGNYSVEINSSTGEINDISINQLTDYQDEDSNLSSEDILLLISKLTSALDFNLNDYKLSIKDIIDYNFKYVETDYKVCTFTNKNNPNDIFVIKIDSKGKFITNYRRNPNKEVYQ